MSNKLRGKVAVVTGSGRGIGRAMAIKLASEGARVVVNDLDDGPAQAVREEIRALGGEAGGQPPLGRRWGHKGRGL